MNDSSIRQRYVQPQPEEQPPSDTEPGEDETTAYRAYGMGKQGRRGELGFVLYYEDGLTTEILYYPYLMRVVGTSHEFMTLMCTDCVYNLMGQNLLAMLPFLKDQKISFLQAYNPHKYPDQPADTDVVIDSITRQSLQEFWELDRQRQDMGAAGE